MYTEFIIFEDRESGETHTGIRIDKDGVICMCCGGYLEKEDYIFVRKLKWRHRIDDLLIDDVAINYDQYKESMEE